MDDLLTPHESTSARLKRHDRIGPAVVAWPLASEEIGTGRSGGYEYQSAFWRRGNNTPCVRGASPSSDLLRDFPEHRVCSIRWNLCRARYRIPQPPKCAGVRVVAADRAQFETRAPIVANRGSHHDYVSDHGRGRGYSVVLACLLANAFRENHDAVLAEFPADTTILRIQRDEACIDRCQEDPLAARSRHV